MSLDLNWINLLILFGTVQGFIFSIILFFNKRHPGAVFLGLFMVVLAYNGWETFNWSSGQNLIFFELFPFIVIFCAGPSIYLYFQSLLYPDRKIRRKQIFIHFGVVLFQLVFRSTTIIVYLLEVYKVLPIKLANRLNDIYYLYAEPLSVIVFLGYLVACIREYRKADPSLHLRLLSKEGQLAFHPWIKALLFALIVLGISWPLTVITPYLFELPYDVHYYPIEIGLVFFIYWIAMVGYHRTRLIYIKNAKGSSPISAHEAKEYLTQLQLAMERDKLYLDPELNLGKTASLTGIAAKTVSAVLNQYSQKSFNDFVNEYRVREVRAKLANPVYQHLTISGIALESGFNSQATFQRAFKNITGLSPREYLSSLLKKTA